MVELVHRFKIERLTRGTSVRFGWPVVGETVKVGRLTFDVGDSRLSIIDYRLRSIISYQLSTIYQ